MRRKRADANKGRITAFFARYLAIVIYLVVSSFLSIVSPQAHLYFRALILPWLLRVLYVCWQESHNAAAPFLAVVLFMSIAEKIINLYSQN